MSVDSLLSKNPLWVVDVGAAGGLHERWTSFTSSYRAVLFEPDPEEYRALTAACDERYVVLNCALSDTPGTIDLNLCRKRQSSSAYLPNRAFLERFPYVERFDVEKTIAVAVDTLDGQLGGKGIAGVDFIKIDAQGYELPILRGAADTLTRAIGVELEVAFAEIYEGQPLFAEVDAYVRGRGFELMDLRRYYWKRKDTRNNGSRRGQLVFGDGLYFRVPEQVVLMRGIDEAKTVRAICVYLSYGYSDLAEVLFDLAAREGLLGSGSREQVAAVITQFKDSSLLPAFWGKSQLGGLLSRMASACSDGWYSVDGVVGNR